MAFVLDGVACDGRAGDTVMTAVLTQTDQLRRSDFTGAPRAGFCLMGACQDCWVVTVDGQRLRACTHLLEPGMRLRTLSERSSMTPRCCDRSSLAPDPPEFAPRRRW